MLHLLSLIGLPLIILITGSSSMMQETFWRRPLLGTLFSVECILGIFLGIYPSKFSELHDRKAQSAHHILDPDIKYIGHHPPCGRFSGHILILRNRGLCAGCTGLVIGAVFSILGTIFYFLLDFPFPVDPVWLFILGVIGVSFGLLQYQLFNWGGSILHMLINIYLVFGVFLLLWAIDILTKNWIIELYLIILSVLWIITRIKLSQVDHRKTCGNCRTSECRFH
jgi:hypothetical protein